MNAGLRMLRLQISRAFRSKTLPYVALISLAAMAVCFVQSCLRFWGHEVGEVPSAAVMWVGNEASTNTRLFSFFVAYLLFPLSAAIFGDSFFADAKSRASQYLATRSSLRAYVVSGAVAAFLVSLVVFFVVFAAFQALALVAFPVEEGQDAYRLFGVETVGANEFAWYDGMMFRGLFFANRYLYNLLYCAYDALWAGLMSLAAYVVSLYVRRSRLVVIGLPTFLFAVLWLALPPELNIMQYMLSTTGLAGLSEAVFVALPVFALALLAALLAVPIATRRDLLL